MQPNQQQIPHLIDALKKSFSTNQTVSKTINHIFKQNTVWTEPEKETFVDTLNGIIRYWRFLWYILDEKPTLTTSKLLNLITLYTTLQKQQLTQPYLRRYHQATHNRVLRESIPDWFDTIGTTTYGSRWENLLHALNQPAPLVLRTNTLKTTKDTLSQLLKQENIHTTPLDIAPDTLILSKKTNIFKTPSFKQGFFEIQDIASQMVSIILDPHPGMRVVDACAGEGGKTLHLAALMHNKGKIIALDTQAWKLTELRRRATRAGADNIETKTITTTKDIKRLHNTADRLLLDVPCSGTGTLRKNPMLKWTIQPEDLRRLIQLQQTILAHYSPLLKTQGILVYSVCSIIPDECEQQIVQFLKKNPTYALIAEHRYYPDTHNTDGFYIAKLKKN
ncbi:MAG: RsmB/NOP family class I SAM-dependent RNA methyltransferase [Candidatus Thermoplasmatota archaeon]